MESIPGFVVPLEMFPDNEEEESKLPNVKKSSISEIYGDVNL